MWLAHHSVLPTTLELFGGHLIARNKSLMKRRAQLGGIRVGIFEEAMNREDVIRFLKRVNQTPAQLVWRPERPDHSRPFDKGWLPGPTGHRTPDIVDASDANSRP